MLSDSDFMILTGQSYSYWINLVELEPARKSLFTKDGDYAKRLNHAIKQVDEWDDWINDESILRIVYLKKSLKLIHHLIRHSTTQDDLLLTKKL